VSLAWEIDRAGGIVAYVLLSAAVLVGLLVSGRASLSWPRFAVDEVHRYLGILAAVFIGVHVLATIAAGLTLTEAVDPFAHAYGGAWTGVGVAATELLAALALTNALRHRLPHRLWRGAHVLNLVVWLGATAHGLGSGGSHAPGAFVFVEVALAILVGLAFLWRLRVRFDPWRSPQSSASS
jgi:methionine sulfoxide reductase heme-binding subunit